MFFSRVSDQSYSHVLTFFSRITPPPFSAFQVLCCQNDWNTYGDSDIISLPAGFRRHLVGKTLGNVFHCDTAEIGFVGLLVIMVTDIFINQRIECYVNNTINLRPLTPHIMPCYPTKWRSCRGHRFCDVTSPCMWQYDNMTVDGTQYFTRLSGNICKVCWDP